MAITVDQLSLGGATTASAVSSQAITTTVAAAAGSIIILEVGAYAPGISVTGITGGGLTWTIAKQGHAGSPASPNPCLAWAYAPAGLAGSTITATFSGSSSVTTISASSFLGVNTTTPIGVTAGPVGVSPAAAAWTTGNLSISAGSAIVGLCFQETSVVTNTPTSSELVEAGPGAAGWGHVAAYRIESVAGSYAVTGTWTGNVQDTTIAIELLAAATGGTLYQTYGPRRTNSINGPFSFFEARRNPAVSAPPATITVKRLPATGVG